MKFGPYKLLFSINFFEDDHNELNHRDLLIKYFEQPYNDFF